MSSSTLDTPGRILIINRDLLLYVGLHGSPSERTFGALTFYFPFDHSLSVQLNDEPWQLCGYAVVPPYVPHRVTTTDKLYRVLMVETENIDIAALLQKFGGEEGNALVSRIGERINALLGRLDASDRHGELPEPNLEALFFDIPLPRRELDPRIRKVVDRINRHPDENFSARDCAREVALSPSRFIHLFNAELGVTLRSFKLWKRARNFLGYVTHPSNLTDLALDIGYPDATYFSHSIRRIYGLKPKDIFAGSRRLRLYS
ncbi:MAG: AraC family transcriptional regulator [Rhodocyclaceae bacterium]|jgi:AraC-like DNA-binding protein|nr:AraC family transcriptional regulator [Rhodocyclaceae bacterium]